MCTRKMTRKKKSYNKRYKSLLQQRHKNRYKLLNFSTVFFFFCIWFFLFCSITTTDMPGIGCTTKRTYKKSWLREGGRSVVQPCLFFYFRFLFSLGRMWRTFSALIRVTHSYSLCTLFYTICTMRRDIRDKPHMSDSQYMSCHICWCDMLFWSRYGKMQLKTTL